MNKSFFLNLLFVSWIGLFASGTWAQKVAPQVGVWKVTGKDEFTSWKADLRFTKKQSLRTLVKYRGYFFWRSTDGETSGIEYFAGTFYKKSGILRLTGYRVKNIRGELAKGKYFSIVANQGKRLSKGRWDGVEVAKGNWSARWMRRK